MFPFSVCIYKGRRDTSDRMRCQLCDYNRVLAHAHVAAHRAGPVDALPLGWVSSGVYVDALQLSALVAKISRQLWAATQLTTGYASLDAHATWIRLPHFSLYFAIFFCMASRFPAAQKTTSTC